MTRLDLLASIVSFSLIAYLYVKRSGNRKSPLPPGPTKLPIIGNLLDIPTSFEWEKYHEWCKEFNSDIIHLEAAGYSIIVLDTSEAAIELLDRRSSIYSGRPRMPMVNELMGWDFNFAAMPYGDRWRQHRRLMHQSFHPAAAKQFRPHEIKATRGLLCRFLDEPGDIMGNLLHMAGETIMSVTYGLEVLPKNDPYITLAEQGVQPFVAAGVPGAFLVDAIPALKYVPEWMPLADFKRKAKEWKKLALAMVNAPFEAAKRNIESGNMIMPSFVSYNLESMDESRDRSLQEYIIKSTAGAMYAAGSDTTVSAIASCILGLLSYPGVLKKAQEEIDSIIGPGQLPSFEDEDSLPYITAIVKETFRWRSVGPIGVPHFLHIEDEYKGYKIPAGSIVIANSWSMLHDETIYPEPFEFRPDRFMKDGKLNPQVKNPAHAAFGFGRRICPARYMAFSAIWIAIASIIATLDITKAIDENGEVIEPTHEYTSALVYMPRPFKWSIKPRSKEAEQLIRSFANDHKS